MLRGGSVLLGCVRLIKWNCNAVYHLKGVSVYAEERDVATGAHVNQ